jgi:transposase
MDDLEAQIGQINKQLRALSPEHRYMPLLMTVPGIGFVLAYTIAAKIGDITRFQARTNSSATPACARGSISPVTATAAAR